MSPESTLAIEASGLSKSFGDTKAVDGVDLAVSRGSVYGMLGPNGAGKTTTIRMLATLLRPDGGEARVLGHDIVREAEKVRSVVSLTGQLASVDEDLTGQENLVLIGRLLGYKRAQAKARADELLGAFDLAEAAGRQVKNFSGGMRRRLDIAASIVVTPELMFLDEPTTGLDPRSRGQVWDIIRALVAEGTTILLSTQYLDEADQLAEGIAVIDHGRVIAEGTPAQLKASVGRGALHVRLLDPAQRPDAERALASVLEAVHTEPDPAALAAPCADSGRAAEALAALARAGVAIADFSLGQPSLDEVFLALTGPPPRLTACAADGARGDRAAGARERRLGRAHVQLARDAEGQARPRAAARRDDHAGDVRRHVHLPVRRRDRRLDRRLPRLHPARDPRHERAVHDRLLRRRAQHRPDQGRRRPLPDAADLAPGAARRLGARR